MAVNITTEKYDPLKVELIKKNLETQSAQGVPVYYEIFVDNLKVVQRTNKVELFDNYEEFVNEDTGKIKILLYSPHPTTPRNTKYIFILKGNVEEGSNGLNGVDLEKKITESVSRERERWACDQVKKDLEDTKVKLKDANDYIETLQKAVEHYKGKKLHMGDINLGELASVVLEGIIRRNPKMLAKLPGGEALAGVIEQDNKEREESSTQQIKPEAEATFKKKSATEGTILTEEEKNYIRVIRQMEENFNPQQLERVMQIIQNLASDTTNIEPVAELLNITKQQTQNPNPNEKV